MWSACQPLASGVAGRHAGVRHHRCLKLLAANPPTDTYSSALMWAKQRRLLCRARHSARRTSSRSAFDAGTRGGTRRRAASLGCSRCVSLGREAPPSCARSQHPPARRPRACGAAVFRIVLAVLDELGDHQVAEDVCRASEFLSASSSSPRGRPGSSPDELTARIGDAHAHERQRRVRLDRPRRHRHRRAPRRRRRSPRGATAPSSGSLLLDRRVDVALQKLQIDRARRHAVDAAVQLDGLTAHDDVASRARRLRRALGGQACSSRSRGCGRGSSESSSPAGARTKP